MPVPWQRKILTSLSSARTTLATYLLNYIRRRFSLALQMTPRKLQAGFSSIRLDNFFNEKKGVSECINCDLDAITTTRTNDIIGLASRSIPYPAPFIISISITPTDRSRNSKSRMAILSLKQDIPKQLSQQLDALCFLLILNDRRSKDRVSSSPQGTIMQLFVPACIASSWLLLIVQCGIRNQEFVFDLGVYRDVCLAFVRSRDERSHGRFPVGDRICSRDGDSRI